MIPVNVLKISYHPESRSYAVILKEITGQKCLPVVVGSFEAQSIALAIEVVNTPRPLTHDLICDLSTNVPVFSNIFFDTVIHCAGKAHIVPRTQKEVDEFNVVNYVGTKNLIKGIDSIPKPPKSFIFISSVAVYGLDEGILINEEYVANPKTAYGISKKLAEELLVLGLLSFFTF